MPSWFWTMCSLKFHCVLFNHLVYLYLGYVIVCFLGFDCQFAILPPLFLHSSFFSPHLSRICFISPTLPLVFSLTNQSIIGLGFLFSLCWILVFSSGIKIYLISSVFGFGVCIWDKMQTPKVY